MKRLILQRKNDYVASIARLSVNVNGVTHNLYAGTELIIEIEEESRDLEVEIKYLFFRRKYKYNTASSEATVIISPTVSNQLLIYSLLLFFLLLLISVVSEINMFDFLFKVYGLTWVALFFFISTIGGKYFFQANLSFKD